MFLILIIRHQLQVFASDKINILKVTENYNTRIT